ncbi:MAG: PHB depolymerase family esterase [Gammaproteobacteria bacterium]
MTWRRAWLLGLMLCFAPSASAQQWPTQPGLHDVKLELRGLLRQRRKVFYYVPSALPADQTVPLVIALHGGLSKPRNIRLRSGLDDLAEREKLIAVYPQGNGLLGKLLHWNAGVCCGKAVEKGIDDAAFVVEVIDQLAQSLPVDRSRVYVYGFSNGAMLTYQIAARHPDKIAAAAAVSGTFGRVTETGDFDWLYAPPADGMPMLIVHGSADPRLPFDGLLDPSEGRGGNGMIPVLDSARFWARANGCPVEPENNPAFENVTGWSWLNCASGHPVQLYRLEDWGHRWAGKSPQTKADFTTVGRFETLDVMWEFFRSHRTKQ